MILLIDTQALLLLLYSYSYYSLAIPAKLDIHASGFLFHKVRYRPIVS